MKKIILFITLILTSCESEKVKVQEPLPSMDPAFSSYVQNCIEALWLLHPNWASSIGYHKFDSVLVIPNEEQRTRELEFYHQQLDSLRSFDPERLSAPNRIDYLILRDQFNAAIWNNTILRSYEWIPSQYNVCEGFAEILNNNYDSLDKRLRNFYIRMKKVPAYYYVAMFNIKEATTEHTELAISQNLGGTSVFEDDLKAALKRSKLSKTEKKLMLQRAAETVEQIKNYAEWLKLRDNNPRNFRLGRKLYVKKFEHDIQSGFNVDQVYDKAFKHKKDLHRQMYTITQQLWPKYFGTEQIPGNKLQAIRRLIDTISFSHVQPDSFQVAIEKQIPLLNKFITEKNLLYIDPSRPLVVRKEPPYMAGLAGASISSPGPYDKTGNTYYNVGSLSGWTKERSESYLREYNHYILQILNIHEAIPGHYTQLVYSNRSPSLVKSIFGNGAMVEGWAVYTELMMLENGYGAPEGKQTAEPEFWLMYYKWNLRSTCNTILDISVHTKNMKKEEALDLLVNEAFQQQAEAEGKWRRVTLSQVQLCSYFTGFTEILSLRDEIKKRKGDNFNLKEFHEKFLSYGSAPVKYIRELMLKDL